MRALQRLALALTTLQMAVEPGVTAAAAAAVTPGSGGEAPLLWFAAELAAPLHEQLAATFATCEPGSPGALDTPELLLGTVQRLAAEYAARVDFLQVWVTAAYGAPSPMPCCNGVTARRDVTWTAQNLLFLPTNPTLTDCTCSDTCTVTYEVTHHLPCPSQAVLQALQLHGAYHVSVEFTRALREAVKQVLRERKLPEASTAQRSVVAACATHALLCCVQCCVL